MEFQLKQIDFFRRKVAILCQNSNGPCPIIAIANFLILSGRIHLIENSTSIVLDSLLQLIGNEVLALCENLNRQDSNAAFKLDQCNRIFEILPRLINGMDLNVQFCGIDKFEFTEEVSIFDALGIPIVHGWLFDPNDVDNVDLIDTVFTKSYYHLALKLVDYRSLVDRLREDYKARPAVEITDSLSLSDRALLREGRVIDLFLKSSCSQLTDYGLSKLYSTLNDGQMAIFFRNNHFNLLLFHQGQLFLLVTDQGYSSQSSIVWELLKDTKGESDYFDSYFQKVTCVGSLDSITPQYLEKSIERCHIPALPSMQNKQLLCNNDEVVYGIASHVDTNGFILDESQRLSLVHSDKTINFDQQNFNSVKAQNKCSIM